MLEGAAFDVTYFEREENGKAQGYWLFPKSAGLYLAKAKMGDGVTPLVDGSLEHIYQASQQFEYGKYAPTPGDNSEGSDQAIVEAPFMFEHGDYVYIAYAGATVDKYYNTNVMRAAKNATCRICRAGPRPTSRRSTQRHLHRCYVRMRLVRAQAGRPRPHLACT